MAMCCPFYKCRVVSVECREKKFPLSTFQFPLSWELFFSERFEVVVGFGAADDGGEGGEEDFVEGIH